MARAHRRWRVVTGPLRTELADYLALRRALGYRLVRPAKLLVQFLDYLDHAGQSTITVAAALDWAQQPASGTSTWWSYRLSTVRGFATYLRPDARPAAARAVAAPAAAGLPVSVFRRGHRRAEHRDRLTAHAATPRDIRHTRRAADRHRMLVPRIDQRPRTPPAQAATRRARA
jgi:hypothetical protein